MACEIRGCPNYTDPQGAASCAAHFNEFIAERADREDMHYAWVTFKRDYHRLDDDGVPLIKLRDAG